MLDFDQQRAERFASRERQFRILGETFTIKQGVQPELMLEWEEIDSSPTGRQALAAMDKIVMDMLVPQDRDRWVQLRKQDGEEAIDLVDLQELIPKLMELATARPFDKSASSGPASENGQTGTHSTVTSDSPVVPALTPSTSAES